MLIDIFRTKKINYQARLITSTILTVYPPELEQQGNTDNKPDSKAAGKLAKAINKGAALTAQAQIELKLGFYGKTRLFKAIRILLLEYGFSINTAALMVEKLLFALTRAGQTSIGKSQYAIAYFNLGEFYRTREKYEDALIAYQRAINILPGYVKAYNNLGIVLLKMERAESALDQFNLALSINPRYLKALNNKGNAYMQMDKDEDAFSYFSRALEVSPVYYMAYYNLGNLRLKQQKYDEAQDYYQKVIDIKPDFADVYYSIGFLYKLLGRDEDSIKAYEHAIALKPDYSKALVELGNALLQLNQYDKALNCFITADTVKMDNHRPKFGLGNVMLRLERHEEAISYYKKALELAPDSPEIYNNLGSAYDGLSRYHDAIKAYEQSLATRPNHVNALNNLGNVYKNLGQNEKAIAYYKQACQARPDSVEVNSNLLLTLNYQAGIEEEDIFTAHIQWGRQLENLKADKIQPHWNDPDANRQLRIGYVSPDFRTHSVAFFIESIFSTYSPDQFLVFAYDNAARQDNKSSQLMDMVYNWEVIAGRDDDHVARLIRNDKIDILVDLAGHTDGNRSGVFAMKPAPIQISYLGYPNTTGLATIDYRITDAITDPEGVSDKYYTEELIRLPDCFLCYTPQPDCPDSAKPPASTSGAVTFCSFNNYSKVNPGLIDIWSRILQHLPDARLVLKFKQYNDETVCNQVKKDFSERGISPKRLELLGWVPSSLDHLGLYNRIDIALDTYPYNGTTTTCEALWMGVPVITLAGEYHRSRVGMSLLKSIGLDELVADTHEDYINKAVELASDPNRLAMLRETLRDRIKQSPLTDAETFTKSLEIVYKRLWQRWCNKTGLLYSGISSQQINKNKPSWIFVVGMARSGSTWVYNITREILAHHNTGNIDGYVGEYSELDNHIKHIMEGENFISPRLVKFHYLSDTAINMLADGSAVAIYSQRDIRDVAVSAMDFARLDFDTLLKSGEIQKFINTHAVWKRMPNVLHVEYADIIMAPMIIILQIAAHIGLTIDFNLAGTLSLRWSLNNVRNLIESTGFKSVSNAEAAQQSNLVHTADRVTLLHDNHIASGEIGRFSQVLSNEEIAQLEAITGDWLIDNQYKACKDNNLDEPDTRKKPENYIYPVTVNDNIVIGVPGDIHSMTTYILLEQEDWFEDEIKFVRRLIEPGMRCIDIGANFGVYALTMSRAAGAGGCIWAIEPNAQVAPFLRWSITQNKASNILYMPLAISDQNGQAWLTTDDNPELCTINYYKSDKATAVQVATLDQIMDCYNLYAVDFVKIDAEGQESNIIRGAGKFLEANSPLIMYEIKQSESFNWKLIKEFRELGYYSYRLIPGLNMLVPVEENETLDVFQLNLFCCREDRAGKLESAGYLAGNITAPESFTGYDMELYKRYFSGLAYSREAANCWIDYFDSEELQYKLALHNYITAHTGNVSPAESLNLLMETQGILCKLCNESISLSIMQTYARVLCELGRRTDCIDILNRCLENLNHESNWGFNIPFIPVLPAFENIKPEGKYQQWCHASVLEQMENLHAYSSYFHYSESLPRIEMIRSLGFLTDEMERRGKFISLLSGDPGIPENINT